MDIKAVFLCLLLFVPFVPQTLAAEIPQTLEAPLYLNVRVDGVFGCSVLLRWTEPDSITKLYQIGPDSVHGDVLAQMDVKIEDGPWRSESISLDPTKNGLSDPLVFLVKNQRHDMNNVLADVLSQIENMIITSTL